MLDTLSKHDLQHFLCDVSQAHQSALLLGYDGTLAPFRKNRYEALPYPGVTPLLKEIMATGHTRLVLITGRCAHELISLLDVFPHPEIWGTHGLERLRTDGSREMQPIDQYTLEALSAADEWIDGLKLHCRAEHKPGSLAVHWRGLTYDEAREIRAKVLLGWLPIADRACLRLEQFDGGVEMRMADPNKGDAVRTILAEMDIDDAPVAYLGNDESDEDAFHILQDRGLCVLVRPQWRETAANVWLRPPVQLLTFLRDWLAASRPRPGGQSHGQ
jgi:trehalose 6-phosphate phosphatase